MKLSSLEIQQSLEYSKVKNVNGLCRALNKHVGVNFKYENTRKYVTEGAEGLIAAHIAHELGLPTPKGYVAFYKTEVEKQKAKENYATEMPTGVSLRGTVYQVAVTHKYKKHYVGTYKNISDAVKARNKKAAELGKRFTKRDNKRNYKGVYKRDNYDHFYSKITVNGKIKYLGSYQSEAEAALAYNEAAAKYGHTVNKVSV